MLPVALALAALILVGSQAVTLADDSPEASPEIIESPGGDYRLVLRPAATMKELYAGLYLLSASGDTVHEFRNNYGVVESSSFCVSDSGFVGVITHLHRQSSHAYIALNGVLSAVVYDRYGDLRNSWGYYFPMPRHEITNLWKILKAYAMSIRGDLCLAIHEPEEGYLVCGIPVGEDRHWRVPLEWQPERITFQDAGIEVTGRARNGAPRRLLLDECGRTVEGP